MDPDLHDRPLYVQTLAWCVVIAFGALVAYLIVDGVGEFIDTVACAGTC